MNSALSLALLLACTPLAAQRTIVVDAAQGAGYDFADIPPAIVAAVDGDTIVVRAGSYSPFRIDDKAISVLGRPGTSVDPTATPFAGIQIVGLSAGRDIVVSGLAINGTYLLASCWISNCSGRVLLDDVHAAALTSVSASAQVLLTRCSFARLTCLSSNVALDRCVGNQTIASFVGTVSLEQSTATCAQCTFIGASAALIFPATPGITLTDSTLRLAGDGRSVVRAGTPNPVAPVAAIDGTGFLVVDPDVSLQPAGGALPIAPSIRVETRDLPFLAATGAALGDLVSIEIADAPGASYFLFWSRAADLLPPPLLGAELWLDPLTIVQARSGALDQNGAARFDFRAPRLPGLIGVPFYWQGVTGTPFLLQLSNPSGYAHSPAP